MEIDFVVSTFRLVNIFNSFFNFSTFVISTKTKRKHLQIYIYNSVYSTYMEIILKFSIFYKNKSPAGTKVQVELICGGVHGSQKVFYKSNCLLDGRSKVCCTKKQCSCRNDC